MYRGRRLFVTATTLQCEPTKAASLNAANEWFRNRRAEIDGIPPTALLDADSTRILEIGDVVTLDATVRAGKQAADVLAIMEAAQFAKLQAKDITPTADGYATVPIVMPSQTRRDLEEGHQIAPAIIQSVLQGRSIGSATNKLSKVKTTPERTVGANFDRFISIERDRLNSGDLGASRFALNMTSLGYFKDWLGEESDVAIIDEIKWLDWKNFVNNHAEWRTTSHRNRIITLAQNFTTFLWELRLIELPRNLKSKKISEKRARIKARREIKTVDVGTVRKFFDAATGQTRLHLLLMLNCGFSAKDISDLADSEIDWRKGIIERGRSKTRHLEGQPVVRWKLWRRTLKLLREYRSGDSIVLKTKSGGQWITEEIGEDDKLKRSDLVASNFKYLVAKVKATGVSPKQFRATPATVLATHPQYKFYCQHFLAHSGQTIADKHYVRPSEDEFFEAIAWLETAILG